MSPREMPIALTFHKRFWSMPHFKEDGLTSRDLGPGTVPVIGTLLDETEIVKDGPLEAGDLRRSALHLS